MFEPQHPIGDPATLGPELGPERVRLLEPWEWLRPADSEFLRWFLATRLLNRTPPLLRPDVGGLVLEPLLVSARRRFLPRCARFSIEDMDPLYEPVANAIQVVCPGL